MVFHVIIGLPIKVGVAKLLNTADYCVKMKSRFFKKAEVWNSKNHRLAGGLFLLGLIFFGVIFIVDVSIGVISVGFIFIGAIYFGIILLGVKQILKSVKHSKKIRSQSLNESGYILCWQIITAKVVTKNALLKLRKPKFS